MEVSDGEMREEVARHVDISQGEIISGSECLPAINNATSVNVQPGAVFVAGDNATINQNISLHCEGNKRRSIEPYTEKDIGELREKYIIQYEKHEIHKVDCNHRIVLEEVKVNEFAVKLKISNTRCPNSTFRGEVKQHFEDLKGTNSKDIELSKLVNDSTRVTFVRGIAGMGKSVLSKQLTYYWANHILYSHFTLCIMFECRDINYFVSNEGSEFKKCELIGEFIKTMFNYDLKDGKDVLFIVDGLDELNDISTEESIIWQLLDISISKYTKSKIVITGRPHVEAKLSKHGRKLGGLWKVEIQGLSELQMKEYVEKFASCEDDLVNINKAKDSSKKHLPILHVPQFLNSFCCVAILSQGEKIRNAAELYCWTFYLLLKQHAEKEGPSEKLISEIFNNHSKDVRALSKICHELLEENKIVLEENIQSQFGEMGKKKEFLEGLFVDVSDNRKKKFQFKHLTLMEFLSAVHCCSMEDHIESIEKNLKSEFYEALLFSCQLIAGCNYDGIIKDMLENVMDLKIVDVQKFLLKVLELVHRYVKSENHSFQLSLDIIKCFMNEDVASKQLIISNAKKLYLGMFASEEENITKLSEISDQLFDEYECSKEDVQDSFQNVLVNKVTTSDIALLAVVKYLKNVENLELHEMKVNAHISLIRQQVGENVTFKKLDIWDCNFEDEKVYERRDMSRVGLVEMQRCRFNKNSFINLCDWGTSSFEDFTLWDIDIKDAWWQELVDAIVKKKNNSGDLALKRLDIGGCTPNLSEELQNKILQCGIELKIDDKKVVYHHRFIGEKRSINEI